jgi:acetyltransferase-like isoleucine patch superfamily enzyme
MKIVSINLLKILNKYIKNAIPIFVLNFVKKLFIEKGKHSFIISPIEIIGAKRIHIGNNVHIGHNSKLCCYGGKVMIGSETFATSSLNLFCGEQVEIGNNLLIASFVLITDLTHGINPELATNYQKQKITTKPVIIEDGCWIGDKASILPGTHIGTKCVIGANSVVKGKIPAYSLVVGNPGKIVKKWDFNKKKWVKVENEN